MKSSQNDLVRCPPCKTNFSTNHAFLRNPRVLDPKSTSRSSINAAYVNS